MKSSCAAALDTVAVADGQEFPVVLVQWVEDPSAPGGRRLEHVDTFHSYVQPTWQPKLTEFCIALTGITQVQVPVTSWVKADDRKLSTSRPSSRRC